MNPAYAICLIIALIVLAFANLPEPKPKGTPAEIERAERNARIQQRIDSIRENPHIDPLDKQAMIHRIENPTVITE